MDNPFEVIDARLTNIESLLLDIKHRPRVPDPLPDRILIQEAAEILGRRVSWIYSKSMSGEIPCEKFGRQLVFSRKELIMWRDTNTKRKVPPEDKASKVLAKVVSTKNNR